MIRWTEERKGEIKRLWMLHHGKISAVAKAMGLNRNQVIGASNRLHLHYPSAPKPITTKVHRAAKAGRTIYRARVMDAPMFGVLKPGSYQRKLGSVVTKGQWKGFPIYSLTLEERATCPRTCQQWAGCYGNGMGMALRFKFDAWLEVAIANDLEELSGRHPLGFVVRLHLLGDFVSPDYVKFWRVALETFPALRVFGYTHWPTGTPTGDAVHALRSQMWDRFAVRTSDSERDEPRANVIETEADRGDSIVCPAQTGKTLTCGTCALCWSTLKTIAFLRH